jgi:hypothetical protein
MNSRWNLLCPAQRSAGHTAALFLIAAAFACDQPTAPGAVDPKTDAALQHIAFFPPNSVDCSDSMLGGSRSMEVRVRLSTGGTAAGVVVAVLSPVHGLVCAGATDGAGVIRFEGLRKNAAVLLSVRDEVSPNVLKLEIVPPSPVSAADLADHPTFVGNRQAPALLGGELCSDVRPLTWASYVELRAEPCLVSGHTVKIQLTGYAPQLHTRVLDASNQPLPGVIVAALSPATTTSADLQAHCMVLPWIDQQECTTNSNGPALLQALGLTDSDGRIGLGVSFGDDGQPVVIETIAEEGGQTLFGTLFHTTGGEHALLTSPGMCTVETVVDTSEPAGRSELDIRSSAHSVGLSTQLQDPSNPFGAPALIPVNSTLVVKLNLHVSEVGGSGRYTLQYRQRTGGMKTVRAEFTIGAGHPETCTVSDGSGKGVGSAGMPQLAGHCAPVPVAPDGVESGRRAYTLFFVLTGVDGVTSAQYDIRTDHDHLDPSRSDPAYLRGSVNFTGLNAESCPVRLNNDGRWIAL